MAYTKGNDSKLDRAKKLEDSFSDRFAQIKDARKLTREKSKPLIEFANQKVTIARSAHALAIVQQARAFVERAVLNVTVSPQDNTPDEEARTTKCERWLESIPAAILASNGFVLADAWAHYFESGTFALRTLFSFESAARGEFPYQVRAIDPLGLAFIKSPRGIAFAVERQYVTAGYIYDELDQTRTKIKNPGWSIPAGLKDRAKADPDGEVEVLRVYTREYECLYVDDAFVWEREHFMGRVPIDLAFCMDMPSNDPTEMGYGFITPIADMLENEKVLFSKVSTDMELYTRPMVLVQTGEGTYRVEVTYPNAEFQGRQVTPLNAIPNHNIIEKLQNTISNEIARPTLSENAFGPLPFKLSGYAYNEAQSGLKAHIKDYSRYPELALGQHLGLILGSVGHFARPAIARELGIDEKKYMNAFSIASIDPVNYASRKQKYLLELTEKDIVEPVQVTVDLEPQVPQDENAKFQRGRMALDMGLPFEYVVREVIHVSNPDVVKQWRDEELLRQANQEYMQFITDNILIEKLAADPKLEQQWKDWKKAQIIAQQVKSVAPPQPPGPMGQAQPGMPGLTPGGQGDLSQVPGQGGAGNATPGQFGQAPMNPADQLAMQSIPAAQ